MKRKITEISVFEFFLCMFVILIHLLSEGVDGSMYVEGYPKWSVMSIIFYSVTRLTTFAVPAFIFTSALKMFYKYGERKFHYLRFLWDRFKKIYIPYLIAVTAYYIIFCFVMNFEEFTPFSFQKLIACIVTSDISAQFYFIVLIVQFYLLMPLWMLISKKKSFVFTSCIVFFAFAITIASRMWFPVLDGEKFGYAAQIFTMHKTFTSYLIFWILGMYVGLYYESFARLMDHSKPLIYAGWLLLAIAHCVLSYMKFGGLIHYTLEPFIVVFFCFFSMFGFYIYAKNLTFALESKGKGFLTSISRASYDIYLIHCLIITIMFRILYELEVMDIFARFAYNAVTTYTLSIVLCVLWATIYDNLRAMHNRNSAIRARKIARRKRYL